MVSTANPFFDVFKVAVKSLNVENVDIKDINNFKGEVGILRELRPHPNVIMVLTQKANIEIV